MCHVLQHETQKLALPHDVIGFTTVKVLSSTPISQELELFSNNVSLQRGSASERRLAVIMKQLAIHDLWIDLVSFRRYPPRAQDCTKSIFGLSPVGQKSIHILD